VIKNKPDARHFAALAALALFLAAALPKTSLAQMAVPSPAEPGIIMRSLEEEKRAPSRLEETVVVPREEAAGKGLSKEKIFVLKQVVLDKTIIYKDADLASLYKDMLGSKVSFADLNIIAQRVTRKYREDGYIFSRAVLPPQKISDGVVHLSAVEGRIAGVRLVGKFRDKNGLIAAFADKIKASAVANTKEMERYLLLIDDLPGITAKSFIKPSETAGGGDLIINIEEDYFEGAVSIDNRSSKYIGPYKGTLVGAFSSTLGIHDRTTFRGIVTRETKELQFGEITHEEQIGSEGFKIKGQVTITSSEPGGNISLLGIQGDSRSYSLEGNYPLMRNRHYNLNLLGGLEALNSATDIQGIKTANDRVRTVHATAQFDVADSLKGVNKIDLTATQGLDILGATDDGLGRSRGNGAHRFLKGAIIATRVQTLTDHYALMLSGAGQMSRNPLLSSEEFTVGGQSYGRAYDAGEITGDSGWAGVAELRYGASFSSRFIESYQVYGNIDYGRVNNKDPAVGEKSRDSLTSAGFGLRFNGVQNFSGYVELDKPLNKDVISEGNDGYRLFLSMLSRF
jgi:hemolysin activation/secretion protein